MKCSLAVEQLAELLKDAVPSSLPLGGGLVTRGMLTEGLNSVGREVSVSGAEPRVIRQT